MLKLSIVIPAYNEEARLGLSLEQAAAFVHAQPYEAEIVVVNNNSTDRTPVIIDEAAAVHAFIHRVDQPIQGKGAALRKGIEAAQGDILFLSDADASVPFAEIATFIPPMEQGAHIAIANRELPQSQRIDEPEYRHIMGRVYNFIVRMVVIPGIHDTQCGFKAFSREAAEAIFPQQTIDGWGFDIEILYIARKRGYIIREMPVTWYYREDSHVSPLRDSIRMFLDVFRVRWNDLRGRYK